MKIFFKGIVIQSKSYYISVKQINLAYYLVHGVVLRRSLSPFIVREPLSTVEGPDFMPLWRLDETPHTI